MNFYLLSSLLLGTSWLSDAFLVPTPTPSTTVSRLSYGPSTLDPLISTEDSSDFEEKMRHAVNGNPALPKKKPTRPDNVQVVNTMEEFHRIVEEEPEKLVVVRFHAPWCRACKLSTPSYFKLAEEIGATIKFVDCPMSSVNSEIHKQLGIQRIPLAHVYHPQAGLVEELPVSRKQLSDFEKVVQSYIGGSCDVMDELCTSPYGP